MRCRENDVRALLLFVRTADGRPQLLLTVLLNQLNERADVFAFLRLGEGYDLRPLLKAEELWAQSRLVGLQLEDITKKALLSQRFRRRRKVGGLHS